MRTHKLFKRWVQIISADVHRTSCTDLIVPCKQTLAFAICSHSNQRSYTSRLIQPWCCFFAFSPFNKCFNCPKLESCRLILQPIFTTAESQWLHPVGKDGIFALSTTAPSHITPYSSSPSVFIWYSLASRWSLRLAIFGRVSDCITQCLKISLAASLLFVINL